jgi:molybdopterin synthase catalytic subunit
MITIQNADFDMAAEYRLLRSNAGDVGAIATFTGLVREVYDSQQASSDKITGLYLEHYPGMTEKSLQAIVDAAESRWQLLATHVIHRVGALQPGDQIVFVGTASAHRQDAFDAVQYIMDYLKNEAPFWKKQSSRADSHWVESRQSDSDAIKRW